MNNYLINYQLVTSAGISAQEFYFFTKYLIIINLFGNLKNNVVFF